jgi:methionyl-tRNA formyltransferase
MKVALLGSRSLGVAVLKKLRCMDGVEIALISFPGGDEKMAAAACAERELSQSHVYWSKQAWALETRLKEARPDVVIAAHWQDYVTSMMREASPAGVLAYHPSLLPRHRGIDAVKWTIACRDSIAGGTVYRMDGGLDEGPIVAQEWSFVKADWTASDLWREVLFPMGVEMLSDVVYKLSNGYSAGCISQDVRFATYEGRYDDPEDRE